ncbi:MAG: molybdate ABC transporter substrate-binding protein [Hydrogenophilales bacterium 17-64-11]|nr:MAG: molybdate ABC transporter substrate-binding protein [Hydrogenophilales bacterium 17-64-11]
MTRVFKKLASALVLSASANLPAAADTAHIAVAANFAAPMKALSARFERASGHRLTLSPGSTGKFYAQIKNGAPFDVLLAADDETPARLMREGDAVRMQTYAVGKLVLWSADASKLDGSDAPLRSGAYNRLAVANPRLAPYGAAAMQALEKLGLAEQAKAKLVMGENIGQTHQFVASGNAELGFVALSQVWQDGKLTGGSAWLVPSTLHAPIRQDAALLKRGETNAAARALLDFLKSHEAQAVIRSYGYAL